MNLQPDEEVAKTGTFLYDGEVICDIRIARSPVCHGSGDYEDPPEIATDHERETFYIEYESTATWSLQCGRWWLPDTFRGHECSRGRPRHRQFSPLA
jgi:hypothetical protein